MDPMSAVLPQAEFERLMQGLRRRDEAVAREVFDRYGPYLLRVVRRRLNAQIRSQYDSADFLQSVWASFFAIPLETHFESPGSMLDFLASIASNKVTDAWRSRTSKIRDVNRNRPLDEAVVATSTEPTPSQKVMADEMMDGLTTNPKLREVLNLLGEGRSHEEVAAKVGLNPKAIQRYLARLNRRVS